METIIRKLVDAGFSLHLAYLTCITTLSYIYGFVIEEQAGPSDEKVRKHASDESILAAILRESQASNYMTDADFLAGLEMILAGAKQEVMQQAH